MPEKLRPSLIGAGGMGGYKDDFFVPQQPAQLPDLIEFLKGNNSLAPTDPGLPYDPILAGIGPAGGYTPPAETHKTEAGAPPLPAPVQPPTAAAGPSGFDAYKQFLIDQGLGPRNQANPYQDRADQFAEKEMQRTALLAQLAFASGVTASAGGSWKEVAQGFNNAGNAYDQGFSRYQTALQKSADRYQGMTDKAYEDNAALVGATSDLYTAGEERARKVKEDENKLLMDSLKLLYPDPEDFTDPADVKRREELIKRSIHHGRLVDFDDVRD